MVKKITVIPVNDTTEEPEIRLTQVGEQVKVEDIIKVEEDIIKVEDDEIREKEEIATIEKVDDKPLQSSDLLSKDDKPKKV
jgi:hypothetical protein